MKRVVFSFILSLLISFPISILRAQQITQTIRGKVVDNDSKIALIGATIIIENDLTTGTTTDENGVFSIKNIKVGRHEIKVSYIGYEDRKISNIVVTGGKETILNVELIESIISMEEVVIRPNQSRHEANNEMVMVSARTFSVEETQRYAASLNDPARTVMAYPGVVMARSDETNEIAIRGNSPKGLLWQIEGMEVPNPSHFSLEGSSGEGSISMLNNTMLSGSDFLTGAFPAEYGNALSGVFDVNLKNGNDQTPEQTF